MLGQILKNDISHMYLSSSSCIHHVIIYSVIDPTDKWWSQPIHGHILETKLSKVLTQYFCILKG